MELTLTEQDAAHWVYRGEGAANVVVSYTGSSPSYIGKVMRIRKSPRKASTSPGLRNTIALSPHEHLIWKEIHELISSSDKEIAGQLYVDHVMKPLLGSKYVDVGTHILVTKKFLETVEQNIDSQPPAWRIDVSQVDKQCDFTLLMSDHSIFPQGSQGSSHSISVEIKPKCGFLPLSTFISEGTAIKKNMLCTVQERLLCYVCFWRKISLFNMMTFKTMTTFMPPPPAIHPGMSVFWRNSFAFYTHQTSDRS
ncbi:unnamed protein product [Lathyrus sativus]|nr:unnamed protein product [Lathyrus sativus]